MLRLFEVLKFVKNLRPKFVNFRANLVEFWVSKWSFYGWDTVFQLSRLQLRSLEIFFHEFVEHLKYSFYSLERCLSMLLFGMNVNFQFDNF